MRGKHMPFFGNTQIDETTGCWNFQSSVNNDGYPRVSFMGRRMCAHRAAAICWLRFTDWRNSKRIVCHRCDNPRCINPKHLFVGTSLDNAKDCSAKGRQASQKKTHCPQGHLYSPENTRLSGNRRYCLECKRKQTREWQRAHR